MLSRERSIFLLPRTRNWFSKDGWAYFQREYFLQFFFTRSGYMGAEDTLNSSYEFNFAIKDVENTWFERHF